MKTVNEIKSLAAKKGRSLTFLAGYLSEQTGKKYTIDGFSKKLRYDTLRYSEAKIIAQALGMELSFSDK